MDFFRDRGRIPTYEELSNAEQLIGVFGSIRRAFRVVLTATTPTEWDPITTERTNDLLVYLALSQFDGRPTFRRLPRLLQGDVKAFFSTYKKACAGADEILFSLGRPDVIASACRDSRIGKLTPTALYVHESAISDLSPILRLYEGCARGYLGRVDGANVTKLYRNEPRISYLGYPEFDSEAHPALAFSVTVNLHSFQIKNRDYSARWNRPLLHRKELFVSPAHPHYQKWARLTQIEEKKGLFEHTNRIGLQHGWNEALANKGVYLKGHRLLSRRSPTS